MPVSYQFDGALAVVKMEMEYSLTGLTQAIHACLADPGCPAQPAVLLDASTGFVPLGLTAADLHALGRLLALLGTERCRSIALIAGSEVAFELLRACAAQAESAGVGIRVFRSAAAAAEWLAGSRPASAAKFVSAPSVSGATPRP